MLSCVPEKKLETIENISIFLYENRFPAGLNRVMVKLSYLFFLPLSFQAAMLSKKAVTV